MATPGKSQHTENTNVWQGGLTKSGIDEDVKEIQRTRIVVDRMGDQIGYLPMSFPDIARETSAHQKVEQVYDPLTDQLFAYVPCPYPPGPPLRF